METCIQTSFLTANSLFGQTFFGTSHSPPYFYGRHVDKPHHDFPFNPKNLLSVKLFSTLLTLHRKSTVKARRKPKYDKSFLTKTRVQQHLCTPFYGEATERHARRQALPLKALLLLAGLKAS